MTKGTIAHQLRESVGLPLTPREWEWLEALSDGRTVKEVAGALGVSPSTAKNTLTAAYRKLSATNLLEALLAAGILVRGDGAAEYQARIALSRIAAELDTYSARKP